jgi:hypothetical protein
MRPWLKALLSHHQRFERSEAIELLERFERASAYDIGLGDRPGNAFKTSAELWMSMQIDRFHGTYPPNYNEGHHLITGKGTTLFQVVPKDF